MEGVELHIRLYTFTIEGILCAYLRQTKTNNQINKQKKKSYNCKNNYTYFITYICCLYLFLQDFLKFSFSCCLLYILYCTYKHICLHRYIYYQLDFASEEVIFFMRLCDLILYLILLLNTILNTINLSEAIVLQIWWLHIFFRDE